MYEIASPTVPIFSACSSGIAMLNSFSNYMINSTVSNESAPRSFVKLASGVTSLSSTPNLSTMIDFTFSATSDMMYFFLVGANNYIFEIKSQFFFRNLLPTFTLLPFLGLNLVNFKIDINRISLFLNG
jgi:hypothetical protein